MTKRQFQAAEYSQEVARTRTPLETYRIVCERSPNVLQAAVQMLMDDGWQPQGGVAMDADGEVMQAMTRVRTLGVR